MSIDIKAKYLKYKKKYLLLKNQSGSGIARFEFLRCIFPHTFGDKKLLPNIYYGTPSDTNNDYNKIIRRLITKHGNINYDNFLSDHKIIYKIHDNSLIITFNVEKVIDVRKNINDNLIFFYNKTKGRPKPIKIDDKDFNNIINYKNKHICECLQKIIDSGDYNKIYINLQECYPSLYIFLVRNLKVKSQFYFETTKLISDILYEKFGHSISYEEMKFPDIKPVYDKESDNPRYENNSSLCTLVYNSEYEYKIPSLQDFSYSEDFNEEWYSAKLHQFQINPLNYKHFLKAYPCGTYSYIFTDDSRPGAGEGTYHLICNAIYTEKYKMVNIHSKVSGDITHIINIINSFTPSKKVIPIFPDQKFKSFREFDHSGHIPMLIDTELNYLYDTKEEFITDEFIIAGDFNVNLIKKVITDADIEGRKITNLSDNYGIDNIILIGKYTPK